MAEVTSATPVTAEKGMFPLLEETNGEGVIRGTEDSEVVRNSFSRIDQRLTSRHMERHRLCSR